MSVKQLSIVPCIPQHAGNHCFLKRLHFLIFVTFLLRKCSSLCVCVCVHTKGTFLLIEYASLLFFVFSQILTTAIQPPPPNSYNHHLHFHMQLPPPRTTTTQCKLLERKWSMCTPVGERKKTTSASCNGWHHHRCKECLRQLLKEKCHQHKLQPVTTMCASGVWITPQAQDAKVRTSISASQ